MKANELRIGNLVLIKCISKELTAIDDYDVQPINIYNLVELSNYNSDFLIKPIQLTEEWLLNFGFETHKTPSGNFAYYTKDIFTFNTNHGWWINKFRLDNQDLLKYVHQLQNLFFALTGKELEVKP